MNRKYKLAIAKTIAFSTVATIAYSVLKADGQPNSVAVPAGMGIATVALAVSEQQGGIEIDKEEEDKNNG